MKFFCFLASALVVSSAALAASPCDDADALAKAQATHAVVVQALSGRINGLNSVGTGECGAFWIERTLGRPYPRTRIMTRPECGVVMGFENKEAAVAAAQFLSVYPGLLLAPVCGTMTGIIKPQ